MTTPIERRRALQFGREALEAIAEDPEVSPHMKVEAKDLLARYPDHRAVATYFLEHDEQQIAKWLQVVMQAQAILGRAQHTEALCELTRQVARRADRHFPQDFELNEKLLKAFGSRQWVDLKLLGDLDPQALRAQLEAEGVERVDAACQRLERLGPTSELGIRLRSIYLPT